MRADVDDVDSMVSVEQKHFHIMPNSSYTASFWIKTSTSGKNIHYTIKEYDSDIGFYRYWNGSVWTTAYTEINYLSADTDWHKISHTFTTNSTAVDMSLFFQRINSGMSWYLDDISCKPVLPVNVWQSSVSVSPQGVFFDGIRGIHESQLAALDVENEWYWNSGNLYVYSTVNPDIAYTDSGIEAIVRAKSIQINQSHLVFNSLHITRSSDNGIENYGAGIATDVTVQNSIIDYNDGNGIYSGLDQDNYGSNWIIRNNNISNNGGYLGFNYQRHGIYIDYGRNWIIEHNTIQHNGDYGIQLRDNSSLNTIKYNLISDNNNNSSRSGIDNAGGIVLYESADNKGCNDNQIYNNVFANNGHYGIAVYGFGSTGNTRNNFYNNSVYGFLDYGFLVVNNPVDIGILKNNIFWSNKAGVLSAIYSYTSGSPTSTMNSDYNIIGPETVNYVVVWNNFYRNLLAYKNGSDYDNNSISSYPVFINSSASDLNISASSPAIDSGAPISGITTDYLGNPIYGNPDIGAYEYQPPYNIISDNPNTSSPIRIYADGKYRYTNAVSGNNTAKLKITPQEGFASNDYSQWMDVDINTWNTTTDYYKKWTEDSNNHNITTNHTIGDLTPNASYILKIDGQEAGIYDSNNNGQITFTYQGGYSQHTFEIEQNPSTAFIPPIKPQTGNIAVSTDTTGSLSLNNLPTNITQIAISTNKDFTNVSWEDITKKEELLKQYINQKEIYIKLRTDTGAVSDTITYTPQTSNTDTTNPDTTNTLQDGDIVKTPSSPDIYVIKIQNSKKYKRLILSPHVFNSYQHLKWENIKTISEEQLNQYQTSSLIQEATDTIIYTLTSQGDQGQRKPFDITQTYDPDSIYTINKVDRDSYEWEE